MSPLLITVAIVVLTVLYALAWHDQPAREAAMAQRTNRNPEAR